MSSVREFAARIARLERGVSALGTSPQLGHSSLDDESINVYDEDGNAKARVGHQHDGTYTSAELDGPVPPVPAGPTVEGGSAALTVAWDGRYEDDARAPLDYRLVEVYASLSPFTDRNSAFLLGHFSNEAGGELTVSRPVGEWHVGLVTKAESGRRSAVSTLAAGTVTSVVDQALIDQLVQALEDLEVDLGELAFAFTTSEDEPTVADGAGKPEGAYWTRINTAGEQVGRWRWTGAAWVDAPLGAEFIPELGVSKLVADQAGFNVAVVNELFADMFTAHKITAEHADLQSFLADTGWVADLRAGILTVGSVPPDALRLGMDELLPDPMFERETQPVAVPFSYSGLHLEDGQARTLKVAGSGLTLASRFWMSDSKVATPGERYMLRADVRTGQRDYGIALGLEIQDADGVKIADLIVPSRLDPMVNDGPGVDPDPEPGDPAAPEPDDDPEYPLNEYFHVDGVVEVPDGGFRVRPWVGLQPGDTSTGADWFISSLSWRDVLSTTSADGWLTQITPNGLEVFTPSGGDSVKLGNFDQPSFTLYLEEPLVDEEGDPILDGDDAQQVASVATVSITDDGSVAAREIDASESITYRGDELAELLDTGDRSSGVVARSSFNTRRSEYRDRVGIGWLRFMAEPGRSYVVFLYAEVRNTNGKGVVVELHLNQGNNGNYQDARIGNEVIGDVKIASNKHSDNWRVSGNVMGYFATPDGDEQVAVTLGISMNSTDSDVAALTWFGGEMVVIDGGADFESDAGYGLLGTAGTPAPGGTAPTPPPSVPVTKKTYKRTFGYRWHKTWQQNGASPSAVQDAAYQGRTPHYPAAGIYRSMVGVDSMTGYLSGADIVRAWARVRMGHSHLASGAMIVARLHRSWNKPGSIGGGPEIGRFKFRRGQERWLTIPSVYYAGLKSGEYRGVSFFVNATGTLYYAQMTPGRTAIRVEYRK